MSGKAYTMREMKTIVEYLNTHKAYGEIRGRKLWTDFASTNLTNRTWQSLKETFLKRILPDIHNPYYGLTRSQIASFKQGYDVDTRSNNKLDIQTISDDSNHSHADNQDDVKPSTSYKDADAKPGEKMSPTTLDARHRASTETIILDNCYETPEDIQRDLESPKSDKAGKSEKETPSKSLRDFITYAEPLTPMMQQVLDDFASDDEGNLEIVENTENQKDNINNKENSEKDQTLPENDKPGDTFKDKIEERLSEIVQSAESVNIPLGQQSKTVENKSARNSSIIDNPTCNNDAQKDDNICNNNTENEKKKDNFVDLTIQTANTQNKSSQVTTQNTNNSTDTTIPGNQEALKKHGSTIENVAKVVTEKHSLSRKRSNSYNANPNQEKKKSLGLKNKKKSQSETEDKQPSKNIKLNSISEGYNVNEELEKPSKDLQRKETLNSEEVKEKGLQINPCLSSVSLYDEQFNKTKYTDSDSSNDSVINAILDLEENENETSPKVLKTAANVKEVVMLKSHSESDDSKAAESKQDDVKKAAVDKKERDRALASVFGFSTGAVSSSRKRKISRRHRSTSFNHTNDSDSSEWTSESDSEYVSPPRGRRNRRSRKYLKPKSSRILSLEEEGGLFVMHGKRIYPLVKDGKIVKNYLTFSPESDPEDDPNYWKKKYEEERKKTEELKKMVEEVKENKPIRNQSPIPPLTTIQSPPKLIPVPDEPKAVMPIEVPKQEVKAPEKTLKIKFTKNNEELQLEGHWSQLHPVLADVVHIFNKDSDHGRDVEPSKAAVPSIEAAPKEQVNGKTDTDDILSIRSTPIDEESVRKKVEKLEEEIFKEIEELDKSEREQAASSAKDPEANVNKRKRIGRPRKSSTVTKSADSSSSPSTAKRTKAETKTEENGDAAGVETERPKRRTKTPKKIDSEISTVTNGTEKKTPKRTPRKTAKPEPETTRPSTDEDDVHYMFPPAPGKKAPARNKTSNATSLTVPTNPTSENMSHNSIESTQGYQDSDASPAKERVMLKRKRKLSLSALLYRGKQKRYTRRRSYPCVSDDASSESSNLSFKPPAKNTSDSIKSYVYQSESYQLLMPARKPLYASLAKIDEMSPTCNHEENDKSALKVQVEALSMKEVSVSPGQARTECNSSNISLPSPELSIVENISVCKELLDSLEDFPTINEMQANNEPSSSAHNKYLMSAVDVTMPLMEQNCEIQKSVTPDRLDIVKTAAISESLTKRNSVDMTEAPTISDSLDSRLRNLLLESAKKMEVDTLQIVNENAGNVANSNSEVGKKARSRKRSSTPHKRNSRKNSKAPDIEPVVEEERMEYCSYIGGRKSCPPTFQMLPDNIENTVINETANEPPKKGRKKKDVIKVKILKPSKKQKKVSPVKATKTKSHDVTTNSVHTDSGINETSSVLFLQDTDDIVDLIHNHSETCLQTRECVGDSIEFVDHNTSIISINSQEATEFRDAENIPPEVFCNNAHDGVTITRGKTLMSSQATSETVYHSPLGSDLSGNSLITEDLSDENACEAQNPRRTKWYLFSEDENTNTNTVPSFGANLMQIFPLTCAVPDLSTITEMSNKNDSRKPTLDSDGDTKHDLDSQSMF